MEPSPLTTLALGLLLGMEHALDADHVVAVSTMVSQHRSLRRSCLVGIFWGLGHTTTLFLVGLVVILFKVRIPERLSLCMEFAVGLVLVTLGASILVFGVGSILGMLGISTLLGHPFVLTAERFASIHQRIRIAAGATSVAYGVWIMAHVGIGEGLFR